MIIPYRGNGARRTYNYLVHHPNATARDIATAFDMSLQGVLKHLKILEDYMAIKRIDKPYVRDCKWQVSDSEVMFVNVHSRYNDLPTYNSPLHTDCIVQEFLCGRLKNVNL